jgi:ornithine carbamoyltransferase
MPASLHPLHPSRIDAPSGAALPDNAALLASARQLRLAALGGLVHRPLQGRNIGLLAQDNETDEARLFTAAALALGARVVWLPTSPWADDVVARDTARLMGRLYDAVECQGLAATEVAWLSQHAGVPVFDALAGPGHSSAQLADALEGGSADPLNRRCVLQAVLMGALAGA